MRVKKKNIPREAHMRVIEVCTNPHYIAYEGLAGAMASVKESYSYTPAEFIAFLNFNSSASEVRLDKPINDGRSSTRDCISDFLLHQIYMRNE
ncbi:hypothetical protein V1477_002589 [Vespula maculifrons]|uniref:Uncharacterized protein n=1 Tax=Vespula maculifrons TaxID=7453 RepID=A0ABD2CWE1_VESMC